MAQLSIFFYVFVALVYQMKASMSNVENSLTFKWYNNVIPEKVDISAADRNPHNTTHLVQYSRLYAQIKGALVIEATNFTFEYPNGISWTKSPGFVDTVFYSYQKHHNLIIRPDDVWTAIMVQFSLYVNANAEKLRHLFVDFAKKKDLKVKFLAPVDQVTINEFITKILGLINENIDPAIYNWVSPNFTTTTENDKLTTGIALMATLQRYFDYGLISLLCGVPQVTVLGTIDDWKQIRRRIEKLNDFELEGKSDMKKWSTMLDKILGQFVSVKEGRQPNITFWEQAIRIDYKEVNYGCAVDTERYLNGWITAFSVFDKSGRWQQDHFDNMARGMENVTGVERNWLRIRTDRITPGIVQVPIKIYDEYAEPQEREYTGAIITGHMGHSVMKDEKTLQPLSGWAMTITNYVPKYLKRGKGTK